MDNIVSRSPGLRVALVGASSLLGKEIKDALGERHMPLGRLMQVDAPELGGQLTEFGDEPAVIQPVTKEVFEDIAAAVFASPASFTKAHWHLAKEAGCGIVDAGNALPGEAGARLWIPSALRGEHREIPEAPGDLTVLPHPAATALAHVVASIAKACPIRWSVATVFEPVSERGQVGVEELHQQTLKLLAFQPVPTAVFDTQVAFNVVTKFGAESASNLHEVEDRIALNLSAMLGPISPPSLRLLQVPVFHGAAFNCFFELEKPIPVSELEEALRHEPLSIAADDLDVPSIVGAAGSNEVLLSRVEKDRTREAGYWIWGALDNLRFSAATAVEALEGLLLARARAPLTM